MISRRWVVRALKTKETGIAISAAERSDSDCAEEILLHSTAPMRSRYLRTTTMWTDSFGVRLHSLHRVPDFRLPTAEKRPRSATWVTMLQQVRRPARRPASWPRRWPERWPRRWPAHPSNYALPEPPEAEKHQEDPFAAVFQARKATGIQNEGVTRLRIRLERWF